APPPTYTPLPTYTPYPTATAIPPTPTPIPARPGIDKPVKYSGVSFTVKAVNLETSWIFDNNETRYPKRSGDLFLVITFNYVGDLKLVTVPQTEDSEKTFHVRDSDGRVDQWTRFESNPERLLAIFVVDGSAENYFFTFPDGQEIDLSSFFH
ncbi:MAG: hypothetical protein ACD_61C00008G0001, partial [uncultured bacterium]